MNKECYQKALRLLTQRDYSRPKLKKKLVEGGYDISDAHEAVEKLYADGYLKEDWYIEARIKGFMRKGYSPSHIRQRLAREELQVSDSLIQEIFNDHGQNEDAQMLSFIEKKGHRYGQLWPEMSYEERQKVKVKLVRALASKGFNPSQSLKTIERFFSSI